MKTDTQVEERGTEDKEGEREKYFGMCVLERGRKRVCVRESERERGEGESERGLIKIRQYKFSTWLTPPK